MSTNVTPQNTTDLDATERQIAAKYMRIVPWGAVLKTLIQKPAAKTESSVAS